jgi:hypothetical protein
MSVRDRNATGTRSAGSAKLSTPSTVIPSSRTVSPTTYPGSCWSAGATLWKVGSKSAGSNGQRSFFHLSS